MIRMTVPDCMVMIDKEQRVFKSRRRIRGTEHSMLWRVRQAGLWSTAQGGMRRAVLPFSSYYKDTGTGDVSFFIDIPTR